MNQYGIVVTGGSIPPRSFTDTLTFNPAKIICADSGFDNAIKLGMTPDAVIGDMDSIQGIIPSDMTIVKYNTDKATTDTELAIAYAIERGCNPIILLGGGSSEDRVDHFLALYHLFHRQDCQIDTWITDTAYITYHSAGTHRLQSTVGETISVFGCGNSPCRATSTGLYWPLDSIIWNVTTTTGISNRTTSKNIVLNIDCGAILVVRTVTAMTALLIARQNS